MPDLMVWKHRKPGGYDPERIWGVFVFPLLLTASLIAVFVLPRLQARECRFFRLTGFPCPTCGSSRALVHLLHGRIGEALVTQPLLVTLGLAYAGYAVYAGFVVFGNRPRLPFGGQPRRRWLLAALLLVLANWAYLLLRHP